MASTKERDKAYADTIINFVNAEKIEEAYFNLIEDIQSAFDFSSDFSKLAKEIAAEEFSRSEASYGDPNDGFWRNPADAIHEDPSNRLYIIGVAEAQATRDHVRILIDSLVNGKELRKTLCQYFEVTHKLFCHPTIIIDSDGSIVETAPFSEGDFFSPFHMPYPGKSILETLTNVLVYCVIQFLKSERNRKLLSKCDECDGFFLKPRLAKQRFCSDKCRLALHNRERIKSGKAKAYKRKKRKEGAKASYYG